MVPIYRPDPEQIQDEIRATRDAADRWRSTAASLHMTIVGLGGVIRQQPSTSLVAYAEEQLVRLVLERDEARATAAACEERVKELLRDLAALADRALGRAA